MTTLTAAGSDAPAAPTAGPPQHSDCGAGAVARHYDAAGAWGGPPDQANRERIARTLDLVPEAARSVLDVGCGDGAVSNELARGGKDVVGVDMSRLALGFFTGQGVVGSVVRLPLPQASFDLVMALEVLEHMPNGLFDRALAELARVSRCWVLVSTPNRECLRAGRARCTCCGAMFNRSLHVRSMGSRQHARLFQRHGLEHIATVGVSTWRQSDVITRVRQAVGGPLALQPVRVCPVCATPGGTVPRPSSARKLALRAVDFVGWRVMRPIPRWLLSLHARDDPECRPRLQAAQLGATDGQDASAA